MNKTKKNRKRNYKLYHACVRLRHLIANKEKKIKMIKKRIAELEEQLSE